MPHLSDDADAAADGGRFGLGSAHSAQTGSEEDPSGEVLQAEIAATSIQHRQLPHQPQVVPKSSIEVVEVKREFI